MRQLIILLLPILIAQATLADLFYVRYGGVFSTEPEFTRQLLDLELAVIQVRDTMRNPLAKLEQNYSCWAYGVMRVMNPLFDSKFASIDSFITKNIFGNTIAALNEAATIYLESVKAQVRQLSEFYEKSRRSIISNLDSASKCGVQFLPDANLLLNKTHSEIVFCGYNETIYFESYIYHQTTVATSALREQLRTVIDSVTSCFDIVDCTSAINITNEVNYSQQACKFDECVKFQFWQKSDIDSLAKNISALVELYKTSLTTFNNDLKSCVMAVISDFTQKYEELEKNVNNCKDSNSSELKRADCANSTTTTATNTENTTESPKVTPSAESNGSPPLLKSSKNLSKGTKLEGGNGKKSSKVGIKTSKGKKLTINIDQLKDVKTGKTLKATNAKGTKDLKPADLLKSKTGKKVKDTVLKKNIDQKIVDEKFVELIKKIQHIKNYNNTNSTKPDMQNWIKKICNQTNNATLVTENKNLTEWCKKFENMTTGNTPNLQGKPADLLKINIGKKKVTDTLLKKSIDKETWPQKKRFIEFLKKVQKIYQRKNHTNTNSTIPDSRNWIKKICNQTNNSSIPIEFKNRTELAEWCKKFENRTTGKTPNLQRKPADLVKTNIEKKVKDTVLEKNIDQKTAAQEKNKILIQKILKIYKNTHKNETKSTKPNIKKWMIEICNETNNTRIEKEFKKEEVSLTDICKKLKKTRKVPNPQSPNSKEVNKKIAVALKWLNENCPTTNLTKSIMDLQVALTELSKDKVKYAEIIKLIKETISSKNLTKICSHKEKLSQVSGEIAKKNADKKAPTSIPIPTKQGKTKSNVESFIENEKKNSMKIKKKISVSNDASAWPEASQKPKKKKKNVQKISANDWIPVKKSE